MNRFTEASTTYADKTSNNRIRLAYLDGIRGLAALYVVLVHSWEFDPALQPILLWLPLTKLLRYGIFAVVIFIVLSGYCLMLPVVRSNQRYFSGGLLGFLKRRIRRILPPYYGALLFCTVLSGLVFLVDYTTSLNWYDKELNPLNGLFSPYFSFHDLLVYLLLLQNFGLHVNKINGPTWTVAVEWQIYFIFAVLLIPIWQRLGLFSTVAIAFVVGLTLKCLMGDVALHARPWFIGLFALGMAAAEINFSQKPFLMRLNKSLPWGVLAAVFASLGFIGEWLRFDVFPGLAQWMIHSFVALGTACFLIYCTKFLTKGKSLPPILSLVLESRLVILLGVFSYSLYITHAPVVWLVHQFLLSQNLSPTMMAVKWFLFAVPLSVVVAYIFHRIFERPFMSHFSSNMKSRT
jgi:peptidoglycan/LPS O-acetylase OafA/YrhL